jgi:hypothetical protein
MSVRDFVVSFSSSKKDGSVSFSNGPRESLCLHRAHFIFIYCSRPYVTVGKTEVLHHIIFLEPLPLNINHIETRFQATLVRLNYEQNI